MSSLMSGHGMVLATAMALSGTVILVSLCRQRPFSVASQFDLRRFDLRPCITSAEKRRRANNQKKAKKVRFGEDIVIEFDDHFDDVSSMSNNEEENAEIEIAQSICRRDRIRKVPANQAVLYNGILQDRLQRMACY